MAASRGLMLGSALLAGLGLGCAERLAEGDAEELLPVCMAIAETLGYWNDGRQTTVLDPSGSAATGCMCMTLEERKAEVYEDELAALAYEECVYLAEHYYEFDSHDCLIDYESGKWHLTTAVAIEDDAWWNHDGLDCDGASGCSVTGGGAPPLLIMPLLLVVVAARRRKVLYK